MDHMLDDHHPIGLVLVSAVISVLLFSTFVPVINVSANENEDSAEVPKWQEGDRWVYQDRIPVAEIGEQVTDIEREVVGEAELNFEVIDDDDASYETYQVEEIQRNRDNPENETLIEFYHCKDTLAEIANDPQIEDMGMSARHPPMIEMDFPLEVGREWGVDEGRYFENVLSGDDNEPDTEYVFQGRVEDRVDKTVEAGEFEQTYMVNFTYMARDMRDGSTEWHRWEMYYSPEVRNVVHIDRFETREHEEESYGDDAPLIEQPVGNETLMDYELQEIEENGDDDEETPFLGTPGVLLIAVGTASLYYINKKRKDNS